MSENRILLYGIGNPGRMDDGLGQAVIDGLHKRGIPGIETELNYQLNIEDASRIAEKPVVIFIDASRVADEPFSFYPLSPSADITFSTHTMTPAAVLALCEELYNKEPRTYVLAIRGYAWDTGYGLSDKAVNNCNEAINYLYDFVTSGNHY